MRTKTVNIAVTLTVRLSDTWTSNDNDAIAIGTAIDRWTKNQPTINYDRVDIGILKLHARART